MASFAKGFEKQQRRSFERELQAKAINTIDALLLDYIYIKFFFWPSYYEDILLLKYHRIPYSLALISETPLILTAVLF